MYTVLRDLRYGLRVMTRNPGITALAVVALALGIGANTAIFSLVNCVLLRPLPFSEPDRLMQVWGSTPSKGIPFHMVFYSDVVVWRGQSRSFETLAAWSVNSANLILGDEPERVALSRINAGYFTLLDPAFLHGRGFLGSEDAPGAAPVAVLSYSLWQRRFASDPKVVGNAINLDGIQYTVVRILPARFQVPGVAVDVFVPLAQPDARSPGTNAVTVGVYGRLKPGTTKTQAQTEMDMIGARLTQEFPGTREIGVRMALGAQPGNVLRMVLGKAVALAAAGVAVGLAGAIALTRVIRSLLYGVSATDPLILAAVSVVLTAVAALAGFFPARRAARIDPIEALRCE